MSNNCSLKIYYQFLEANKENHENIITLEKLGHKVINSMSIKNEVALEEIKNADVILFNATNFPNFCFKKWIYADEAIKLNKEIWVVSKTQTPSLYINSIFKNWFEVYSELHPV